MNYIQKVAICSLCLAGSMLMTPVIFAVDQTVAVVETKVPTMTNGKEATVPSTQATSSYELPYPGMLPDSPLYFLKQVRDWILDRLISDPVKKADFYVLQADKRLSMGISLMTTGKGALAEQTISKGEKYMNNSVALVVGLKSQGKEIPGYVMDHVTRAIAKHDEVLTKLSAEATDATEKSGLTGSLTLVKSLEADLAKLK